MPTPGISPLFTSPPSNSSSRGHLLLSTPPKVLFLYFFAVRKSDSHLHCTTTSFLVLRDVVLASSVLAAPKDSQIEDTRFRKAAKSMQDLTTALLIHGGLLVGYGSPLVTYFILRRKAQQSSTGRPTIQIPWWKSVCKFLSIGLFTGAIVWIVAIADLFGDLAFSLNENCPSLITPDECSRATLDWQATCIGLIECACAAISIILWTAYAESNRIESPPERSYPLVLLTISHCMLVASWDMCTPLTSSLKAFSIIGTKYWIAVSSTFAFISILAYIVGTTLWIIALIRVFYVWRCRSRSETPAEEQWPQASDRDLVLLEI